MSKTEEKTLLSQNWAQKMFYVILPAYFKELQKYQNLQFLVKTSPKITFYIVRAYYIITIYIFTTEIYHNMQYEVKGWLVHSSMNIPLLTSASCLKRTRLTDLRALEESTSLSSVPELLPLSGMFAGTNKGLLNDLNKLPLLE